MILNKNHAAGNFAFRLIAVSSLSQDPWPLDLSNKCVLSRASVAAVIAMWIYECVSVSACFFNTPVDVCICLFCGGMSVAALGRQLHYATTDSPPPPPRYRHRRPPPPAGTAQRNVAAR